MNIYPGMKVGKLTIGECVFHGGHGRPNRWEAQCSCGATVVRATQVFTRAIKENSESACENCLIVSGRNKAKPRAPRGEEYGKFCIVCYDQPWHRPPQGCWKCHKPTGPIVIEHAVPGLKSSAGSCVDSGFAEAV